MTITNLTLHETTSLEDAVQSEDRRKPGVSKFNGVGMGQNGLVLVYDNGDDDRKG
jgi:hypothetical protein